MKAKKGRLWVSTLSIFLGIFFLLGTVAGLVLWGALGRRVGNQVRREKVRKALVSAYGARPVSFFSEDGVPLSGLIIERPQARGTVVLCHGFRHSKEQMARYIGLFPDWNIFLFDFRSFGQSGGMFSSLGFYESNDVKAAVAFLRQHLCRTALRPLVIFGVSMGASAALKAAAEVSLGVDGLILDSPYAVLADVVYEAASQFSAVPGWLYAPLTAVIEYTIGPVLAMNPERYSARVGVPVLFIHSLSDGTTSAAHSMRLFARMLRYKRAASRLWLTPPAPHARSYVCYPKQYARRVGAFLELL